METFIADPTEVLMGFMSSVGRPRGDDGRADFDYGRVAVCLEILSRARFLHSAGLIAEGAAMESLLQDLGLEERIYAIYERLSEWRRVGFVAVPSPGFEGEGLSPMAWSRDPTATDAEPHAAELGDIDGADVAAALSRLGSRTYVAGASGIEVLQDDRSLPRGSAPPAGTELHEALPFDGEEEV